MIKIIVAVSNNGYIGMNNKLPWHIPEDLEYFKQMTLGHKVLMGRTTWDGLPGKKKPLSGRTNIILTSDEKFNPQGKNIVVAHSVDEVLDALKENEDLWVIGGRKVLKQFLPIASEIYLTRIQNNASGDVKMPEIDYTVWKKKSVSADKKSGIFRYAHEVLIKDM